MLCLIGGTPSSGTTALLSLCSRFPSVTPVHETGLFGHPSIYSNFSHFKSIFSRTSSSDFKNWDEGERLRKGLNAHAKLNGSRLRAHGVSLDDVLSGLEGASTGQSFLDYEAGLFLNREMASLVIEKLPGNLYAFKSIHDNNFNVRTITIVRNPFDTVASLTTRGVPLLRAMALWTLEAAIIQSFWLNQQNLTLHYENLVRHPNQVLTQVATHLGISERPLDQSSRGIPAPLTSWRADPRAEMQVGLPERKLEELDSIDKAVFLNSRLIDGPSIVNSRLVGKSSRWLAGRFGYELPKPQGMARHRARARYQSLRLLSENTDVRVGRSRYYESLLAFGRGWGD